ncbi:mannitol dehydrogenase family protein [Pseudomonas sp. RIT-PI-S]|uniref:mannitol dehydrogenase family protein n=1 Tax=Pseudomonas sp. RIT-PI-S TaxID=3035295 RepID=UPI0021DA98DE|nr:mannitol dehydrogenase family protein [Pseudomonas sp. RIT-PI-S]
MTTTPLLLSLETLDDLPDAVKRPSYRPELLVQGIVHIGVGGFHRAHQAFYTDALMNQGKALDWAICGAGLRSEDRKARDDLAEQEFFFTLFELGDTPDTQVRVIGSLRDMLLAEDGPEALIARLSEPNIRIVSLTITEGGYCIDDSNGQFMAHLPLVQHDLANPREPRTVFGFLCAALQRRREAGIRPFTVMSCDNLPHNGQVARKALLAFANLAGDAYGAGLAQWIDQQVSFPNAMVDRITPMTSAAHREQLLHRHGIDDAWPVVCEPFVQWVLEDNFCDGRPAWEDVGVQFTQDVTPYEEMKIKLLNGSHLALTYLGFLRGYRFVHETMNDPLFVQYIRDYMNLDVTPQLAPVPGIDLSDYKDTLIERFSNQAIADQLERVCSDGSSKFPKFTVPTINELIRSGGDLRRAALVVAAWALYLRGVDEAGTQYRIPDPRAEFCQALVAEDQGLAQRLLGVEEIFGLQIPASAAFVEAFEQQLQQLRTYGVEGALRALVTL